MAEGRVTRLRPRSEKELRDGLRQIGFGEEKIEETVRLVREEIGSVDRLDVMSVFQTPDGVTILPEKKAKIGRPKPS